LSGTSLGKFRENKIVEKIKKFKVKNKYIPVILGITGGIVAIPAMYLMADFPASDVVTAIVAGIMSGLASTGVNQVYKQANKDDEEKEQEAGESA
jgi:ribonucleotide monophosphatase NagD (HAD superfamily)